MHWYANYACRDDYGCDYDRVSAWAGVHYFASRDGQGRYAESGSILTWPEGNGWIVRRLQERLAPSTCLGVCVHRLEGGQRKVLLDVYRKGEGRSLRIVAEQVIWAAPLFLLPRVMADCPPPWRVATAGLDYSSPWVVANLELAAFPEEKYGSPLSWDNVIQDSPSLGYVVATHQQWRQYQPATVFTWYQALSSGPADAARRELLASSWQSWRDAALANMGKVYVDLPERLRSVQVRHCAHAMVRPTVGSLWGPVRAAWRQGPRRLHLAHADLSGFSIFEEACSHGMAAAERVAASLAWL